MVRPALTTSILGRALEAGAWELGIHDIRAWGRGRHRTVDDTPYGGGSGMVMRVDVLDDAIGALRRPGSLVLLCDPVGRRLDQAYARELARQAHVVLVCGHYEGVDARVRDHLVDGCVSVGDFVLTGGEIAAMAVVDAVVRLLPGALGNAASSQDESFSSGVLEYPQYTRPRDHRGHAVPEVLLSGHHGEVERWRREQARALTRSRRPDLADPHQAAARITDTPRGDTDP